jgi:DedD protein
MVPVPVKERITGAIILVAVLVLLVPELLTGPSRSVRMAQPATSADGAQMRSYTIDLADDAAHGSAALPVTEQPTLDAKPPDSSTAGADGIGVETEQSGDAAVGAEPESSPAVAPMSAEPAVASIAEPAKPDPRAESPKPAPVARAEIPKPAPTARAEAPKPAATGRTDTPKPAASEPAAATRTEAAAVRASEPPARTGSADSKPTSGWAVQVGSFASRDNAERLAQKLKGKGFAATISQTSKGRRLWRVRVGPEADREAATALRAKLRSAGQPGTVVPYP